MPDPQLTALAAAAPQDPLRLARTLRERVSPESGGDPKALTNALIGQARRDGLFWCVASPERGGMGLSLGDVSRITFELARASGSFGLIYAMHMSQALTLLRHSAGSPFLEALTDGLIARQALVASGTSEKGVGGDIFGSICAVEDGPDGVLQVAKQSPNISYLDHAEVVLVTAMQPSPAGRAAQVLIAAETSRMDLQPGRETRMMGMQGILNRPYDFTAAFDPPAVFPQAYPAIARQTMTPSIHVLWAALWSGLAAHALGKARTFLGKEFRDGEGSELMRVELSRLVDRHYVMNALIREAALEFDTPGSLDRPALGLAATARIKRLKVVCSELAQDICQGALGLIGLRGYAEEGPYSLSEVIRDALSARVMISNYRLALGNAPIERHIEEEI